MLNLNVPTQLRKLTSLCNISLLHLGCCFCVLHGRPQWTGSGRSGVRGAIAQWPVPTELNSGRGSAQRLLMGDLSAEDIGRRAENAPTLNAQVRLRFLLHLINSKGNLNLLFYFQKIFLSLLKNLIFYSIRYGKKVIEL